mmetsp:Transcript_17125/g.22281  ORF Transcript_17125/g.22281 Transcript_17125/m.22281 type:complete len:172 (-) Transcript_17125:21-536(-)
MPINATAGMAADGALPKAAMPLGSVKTPAPTMPLIKLNISAEMEAVPPPFGSSPPSSNGAAAAADSLNKVAFLPKRDGCSHCCCFNDLTLNGVGNDDGDDKAGCTSLTEGAKATPLSTRHIATKAAVLIAQLDTLIVVSCFQRLIVKKQEDFACFCSWNEWDSFGQGHNAN